MKSLRILLFLTLTIALGCREDQRPVTDLIAQLPPGTSAFVKINNPQQLQSELKSNKLIQLGLGNGIPQKVEELLRGLSFIEIQGEQLLAITNTGRDSLAYLYIARQAPDSIDLSSAKNKSIETITSGSHTFKKYEVEDLLFFTTQDRGTFKMSNSIALLKHNVETEGPGVSQTLRTLYETANPGKNANIFLNLDPEISLFQNTSYKAQGADLAYFSDWIALDAEITSHGLRLNGVGIMPDSTNTLVPLFRNAGTLAARTPDIAPENSLAMVSYVFRNKKILDNNLGVLQDSIAADQTVFETVEELGIVYMEGSKAVMLHTYGSEDLNELLGTMGGTAENSMGSEIFALQENDILTEAFSPLLVNFKPGFYTVLENTFVFAKNRGTIQEIIASHTRKATYRNSPAYQTVRASLADESNILLIASEQGLKILSEDGFRIPSPMLSLNTGKEGYIFAMQVIAENNFFHTTLLAQQEQGEGVVDNTWKKTKYSLQSKALTSPQFVTNHRSGKKEVVIQDEAFRLYLIDPNKGILWTKQLDGPIQGEIHQVDLYKNGRLQLAFTTDHQFIILDRNGKEVAPFTFSYPGGNLNPLAVFDYNRNRDYRFVVTQGEAVKMYNSKGKIVKGFTYTKAESPVLKAPKHFRISGKDYLVFLLENGQLKILNRVGKTRVPVKRKIDFSDNEVFVYKNNFAVTEKNGHLVLIDGNGKISQRNLNLPADHGWAAQENILTYTNENLIHIGGKEIPLDYGVYTKPRIFRFGKQNFIALADLQSRQVFLMDDQGNYIPGFPVYGNTVPDMADWDNNNAPDLVTVEEDLDVRIYSQGG